MSKVQSLDLRERVLAAIAGNRIPTIFVVLALITQAACTLKGQSTRD